MKNIGLAESPTSIKNNCIEKNEEKIFGVRGEKFNMILLEMIFFKNIRLIDEIKSWLNPSLFR